MDSSSHLFCLFIFYEYATTVPTSGSQEILYDFRKFYVNYGNCEFNVTEVTRATNGSVAARPASLSGFQCAQPTIHEARRYWGTVFVFCICSLYFFN